MPPSVPRPIAGWSDEQLRNYADLCLRTLRENLTKLERARDGLANLSKGARRSKIKVLLGIAIFAGGLATTAVTGPVGAALAFGSCALELDGLADVVRDTKGRARLRGEIAELERTIAFWRTEQARVFDERNHRAGRG